MPALPQFIAFLATAAIFAFVPGPAMLYAAARTLTGGRHAGLMASLGIHLGGYVHVIAAAVGLSFLFQAVPLVYMAVKLAGAGYLAWLGGALFRARDTPDVEAAAIDAGSARRAFVQSIAVEVLNPKTALFFLTFLPQFIDGSAGIVWVQFVMLGTIVNVMFSCADFVCVLLAGAIMTTLRRSNRAQRLLRRACGSVLIGLGTHLDLYRG